MSHIKNHIEGTHAFLLFKHLTHLAFFVELFVAHKAHLSSLYRFINLYRNRLLNKTFNTHYNNIISTLPYSFDALASITKNYLFRFLFILC